MTNRILTQQNRILKLHLPSLEKNTLIPIEANMTESISQPFNASIQCLCNEWKIPLHKVMGQAITLERIDSEEQSFYMNGVVSEFTCDSIISANLRHYSLKMIPTFATLNYEQNCQIFKNMNVLEIFKQYSHSLGFFDFDTTALTQSYPALDYKTQFNESAFAFLSRLLEEAGISYYFSHTASSHCLKLIDNPYKFPQMLFSTTKSANAGILSWLSKRALSALQDPSVNQAAVKMHFARSDRMVLGSGYQYDFFSQQPSLKDSYLITHITHKMQDHSYLPQIWSKQIEAKCQQLQHYENAFECINTLDSKFMPRKQFKKPLLPDLQTAFVTGPKDYEKNVYTDHLGRVQVSFIWNNNALTKNSIFVPVCQLSAGQTMSSQFIPRIGQEVLISFVGGDMDKPVVLGAVPNAATPPAFDLAQNPNLTWIKSHTLHSNDPNQGNVLLFDDTLAQEKLHLHASKDYLEEISNQASTFIEGNDHIEIDGNALLQTYKNNITLKAKTLILRGGGSEIEINANGISIKGSAQSGGRINLLSPGAGSLKPIARVSDNHQCPKISQNRSHQGGPILTGAHSITANLLAVARQGDHALCRVGKDTISQGIQSIIINGKPVARVGHSFKHGGVITSGSPNVFVGEKA